MTAVATLSTATRRLLAVASAAIAAGLVTAVYVRLPDRVEWIPERVIPTGMLSELAPLVAATFTLVLGLALVASPASGRWVLIALLTILIGVLSYDVWWAYEAPRTAGVHLLNRGQLIISASLCLGTAALILTAWFRAWHTRSFHWLLAVAVSVAIWLFCLSGPRLSGHGL